MILSNIMFVLTTFIIIPVVGGVYFAWPILAILTAVYVWTNLKEIRQRHYTWEYDWIPMIVPVLCIWMAHAWTWRPTSFPAFNGSWWQVIRPYIFR
jgi:hypothetical protein